MATLAEDLQAWLDESRQRIGNLALEPRLEQVGHVAQIGDGVATVTGLPETRLDELLIFDGGVRGLAVDLDEETIGCVLLGDTAGIAAGSIVRGTGEVARVPVGDALLGRAVDALGVPLDGGSSVAAENLAAVEQPAPAIVDRALVTRPLATGLLVIDAMIPLGRERTARTDYRRPQYRQDGNRRRCHHQPAFDRRDLCLCCDWAKGVVGCPGHRGGAAVRRAGTVPVCHR